MSPIGEILCLNADLCTGCRQCELACSFALTGTFAPEEARLRIEGDHLRCAFVPVICRQCLQAPCQEACPVNALVRDSETGAVMLLERECIGCLVCLEQCPFGAMSFKAGEAVPKKCELCGGEPKCVSMCFPGALRLVRRDEVDQQARSQYAQQVLSARQAARRLERDP